jgi:hypothetical protein
VDAIRDIGTAVLRAIKRHMLRVINLYFQSRFIKVKS